MDVLDHIGDGVHLRTAQDMDMVDQPLLFMNRPLQVRFWGLTILVPSLVRTILVLSLVQTILVPIRVQTILVLVIIAAAEKTELESRNDRIENKQGGPVNSRRIAFINFATVWKLC